MGESISRLRSFNIPFAPQRLGRKNHTTLIQVINLKHVKHYAKSPERFIHSYSKSKMCLGRWGGVFLVLIWVLEMRCFYRRLSPPASATGAMWKLRPQHSALACSVVWYTCPQPWIAVWSIVLFPVSVRHSYIHVKWLCNQIYRVQTGIF